MSSFLSLFSSKTKASRSKAPPLISTTSKRAPVASLPQLKLPSPSLLIDSTSQLISDPSPSAQSAESSPWVKVDEGEGKERDVEDARAETRTLGKVKLGVGEVTELMRECGSVVRERGSTTLGIFRPYRFAESPSLIRKLSLLFLAYAQDYSPVSDSAHTDLWGSKNSKAAKLERFREELKYAGVHDVVIVLKWGLRHLSYSTSFAGTRSLSSSAPLAWYKTFCSSSSAQFYPTSAFTTLLLPSLPASSRALLLESLALLQAVSAHAETNAMPPRKLARMLGLYVFGLADPGREWKSWEELYVAWQEAGDAMEGCFKAYLREQTDLPKRLAEIVEGYPAKEKARKIRVVRVELESQGDWTKDGRVNDQRTGLKGEERAKAGRRDPLEILEAAFEASEKSLGNDGETDDARTAWHDIVRRAKDVRDPKVVLSDEVVRVLQLVSLDSLPAKPTTPTSPSTPTRRRSFSYGRAGLSPLSEEPRHPSSGSPTSLSNFPNKSVGNLLAPKPRIVTPSWSDFATAGFGEKAPFESNEFGLIAPKVETVKRSQTVGPAAGRANLKPKSPVEEAPRAREALTKVLRILYVDLDEEFTDVYLDTLVDPTACGSWPSFIISDLCPSLPSHLLITQLLIPPKPLVRTPSALSARSLSIAESTTSRSRWNRRMSGLFTGSLTSKARLVGMGSQVSLATIATSSSPKKGRVPQIPEMPRMSEEEALGLGRAQVDVSQRTVAEKSGAGVAASAIALGALGTAAAVSGHEAELSNATNSTLGDEVRLDSAATFEVNPIEVATATPESFELVDTPAPVEQLVEESVVEEPVVLEAVTYPVVGEQALGVVEQAEPVVVEQPVVEEPVVVEAMVEEPQQVAEVVEPVIGEQVAAQEQVALAEAVVEEAAVDEPIVSEPDVETAAEEVTPEEPVAIATPIIEDVGLEEEESISTAPVMEEDLAVASPLVEQPPPDVEEDPVLASSVVEKPQHVEEVDTIGAEGPAMVEVPVPVSSTEQAFAADESSPAPILIDTTPTPSPVTVPSTPLPASSPLPTSPSLTTCSPLSLSVSATSATSTLPSPSRSPTTPKKFLGSKAIGGLLRRRKSSLAEREELKEKKREEKELRKAAPSPVVVPTKVTQRPVSSVKKRVLEIEATRLEAEKRLMEREREMSESSGRRLSVLPKAVEQAGVPEATNEESQSVIVVEEPQEVAAPAGVETESDVAEEAEQLAPSAIGQGDSLIVPAAENSAHWSPSLEDEAYEDAPLSNSALFPPAAHHAIDPSDSSNRVTPSSFKLDTPSSPADTIGPSPPFAPTEPSSFVEPSTPTLSTKELVVEDTTTRNSGETLRSFASQNSLADTARSFETAVSKESAEARVA